MDEAERATLESVRERIRADKPEPVEPGFFDVSLTPEYHPKVRLHGFADKLFVQFSFGPDDAASLALRLIETAEACREKRRAFMAGEYPPREE